MYIAKKWIAKKKKKVNMDEYWTENQLQWNLSNPTQQGTREMCLIVQDVWILRFYFS
jgi:hypothetical protein